MMMMGDEGVYFACQRCTACCRWPGDVRVSEGEVEAMAAYLNVPVEEFIEKYTRLNANRTGLSVIEKPGSDECALLDGNDCRVQGAKPQQCVDFPNRWNFPGWREVCQAVLVKR